MTACTPELVGDPDLELDGFLRELDAEPAGRERAAGFGLLSLSEALDPLDPAPDARARMLASVPATGRFARFAQSVAKLLDLGLEQAASLLDRLDDNSNFSNELPGISFFWVDGGPQVANAVRGFLRVAAGTSVPDHEHLGIETVLVLQGAFTDAGRGVTLRAGDIDVMPANSSHTYWVPEDGPDLLLLSVTQVGARMLGMTYLPR